MLWMKFSVYCYRSMHYLYLLGFVQQKYPGPDLLMWSMTSVPNVVENCMINGCHKVATVRHMVVTRLHTWSSV